MSMVQATSSARIAAVLSDFFTFVRITSSIEATNASTTRTKPDMTMPLLSMRRFTPTDSVPQKAKAPIICSKKPTTEAAIAIYETRLLLIPVYNR